MTTLIMWGMGFLVAVLLCAVGVNEAKFKKNIAVGVTFPREGREDAEVLRLLRGYKREQIFLGLAMTALAILCAALAWPGLDFLAYFLWIDLLVVTQFVCYARWNGKLKAVKRARGWTVPAVRAASVTIAAEPEKQPGGRWFAAAAAVAAMPAALGREMWSIYLLDAALALGCWAGAKYLYRNRSETVDENDAVTQALTRVRRRAWDRVWVLCAWTMAAVSVGIWLSTSLFPGSRGIPWLTAALAIGVCAVAVALEFRVRRVQEKLTAGSGEGFYVDEDDKWLWGQLYYDPNDSRVIINARTGINSTVNLARPGGKAFMVFALALLFVVLPVMGVWLDGMAAGPQPLKIEDGALVASSAGSRYELPLDEIDEAELLEALPAITARTMGVGLDSLLQGKFQTEWGSATLCLDPRQGPWLRVTMADGTLYLLGGGDVEAVYEQITK